MRRQPLNGIQKEIDGFLRHLRYQRDYSKETCRAYQANLIEFRSFLEDRIPDFALRDLTTTVLRQFLVTLYEKKNIKSTVARKLSAIRSFLRHLSRSGLIPLNPADSLSGPKLPKHLPQHLTETETDLLLATPDRRTLLGKRDGAILELLYATGIRVGELVGLSREDCDFRQRFIRVLGKGKKERIVPFGRQAEIAMRDYLDSRDRQRTWANRFLFLNARGGRLSDRSVRRILDHHIGNCALSRSISPHGLRHTFASLSTTQRYTSLSTSHLLEVHRRSHPRSLPKKDREHR